VDQLARPITFVTASGHLRGADQFTGERVECAQSGEFVAAQHPAHRARREAKFTGQPVLASAVLESGGHDPGFDLVGRGGWDRVRTRGSIVETWFTFGIEACDPTVSALTGDPHRSSDVGDGHAQFADAMHD